MQKRKILVTAALPYANGEIHLGHLVESIQTDIFVRYLRMNGHTCWFICGSDAHGTPIMLNAQKQGITAEALISRTKAAQEKDFAAFDISFDNFYTTHSNENETLCKSIYTTLYERGDISTKTIAQAFDAEKNMFLPDRFIKGECPRCSAKDQYGDNCEVCGATYSPTELKNPRSAISGSSPIQKESQHYFFNLERYTDFLKTWLQHKPIQPEVVNKLQEWFNAGLKAWDISRDGPYFGFSIPNTDNKYFYVWLDAPIGYMASFKNFCDKTSQASFDDYWHKDSDAELYHFIGKDIMYFHTLFWPAILHGAGYRTPSAVFVHGFLTLNGAKMSKSRGTFIQAATYLNHLNPAYLRYYFASKLNAGIRDVDLSWDDFIARVNSDLVGKVINIASRCAGFIYKRFSGQLSASLDDATLFETGVSIGETIGEHFEARNYHLAIRDIMLYADKVNQYIDKHKPWECIKDPDKLDHVQNVCSMGIQCFKLLMTYLKPIIPSIVTQAEAFLNCEPLTWENRKTPLCAHIINRYQPLITRVELEKVNAMQEEAKNIIQAQTTSDTNGLNSNIPALKETISFEDFAKCDLRVVTIVHAEAVPEANKLIKVIVDLGGVKKQIFAGIKKAFEPETLIGQQTLMIANLAPRKMRFGISEGMLLIASGEADDALWLLRPDAKIESGTPVK